MFKTYQDAPVIVLIVTAVSEPSVKNPESRPEECPPPKKGLAHSNEEDDALTSKLMVAYESSTMSGKKDTNTGFNPDAFHDTLTMLFQIPDH